MIVLVTAGPGGFAATKVGVRHRLRVHGWASRLDRELASGASPESTRERALHAQRLVAPSSRRGLARSIQRGPGRRATNCRAAPARPSALCRDRVQQASAEFDMVRERLIAASPLAARGVAMLRVLLTDGSGPLYQRRSRDDLRSELTEIAAALTGDQLDDVRGPRWS